MNKLYIFCGIPFSGKSFLAKKTAVMKGFSVVDLDEIKFGLFGSEVKDNQLQQKDWDRVYQKMYEDIEKLLHEGKTVIHDTGNFTKSERDKVKMIADKLNIETVFVYVDTPKGLAYKRLLDNRRSGKRFDVDDIDFESCVRELEIPTGKNVLVFRHSENINSWVNKNI